MRTLTLITAHGKETEGTNTCTTTTMPLPQNILKEILDTNQVSSAGPYSTSMLLMVGPLSPQKTACGMIDTETLTRSCQRTGVTTAEQELKFSYCQRSTVVKSVTILQDCRCISQSVNLSALTQNFVPKVFPHQFTLSNFSYLFVLTPYSILPFLSCIDHINFFLTVISL